jgi:hypothetical protein
MRWIVFLYIVIGIALVGVGFVGPGECPEGRRNTDPANQLIFILTWPVTFYGHVVAGPMTPTEWAHQQSCEGGVDRHKPDSGH